MAIRKNALALQKLQPALPLLVGLPLAMMNLLSSPACKQGKMPLNATSDTTSHNFVFQIDTLGDGESSVLNDVCIIDENNIWAVGEIYLKDSTGQFVYPPYNAAQWNGRAWNLLKIPVRDFGGLTLSFPLKAVFGFAANNVWVASDANLIHWNGSTWATKALFITDLSFNGQVLKMWGTSGSNLYLVGRNGAIYHYNGSSWQKLASGSTVDIQDIWGAVDNKTGQQTILAVASFRAAIPQAKQLLRIQGNTVSTLSDTGLPFDLSGIWFIAAERYFVVGDGVYYSDVLGNSWQSDSNHPLLYKDAIRGIGKNDIFIAGSFGLVSHYNGVTWKHYTGTELPRFYGRYKAASYKGNLLVAVGWLNEQAVILRGKRR